MVVPLLNSCPEAARYAAKQTSEPKQPGTNVAGTTPPLPLAIAAVGRGAASAEVATGPTMPAAVTIVAITANLRLCFMC
jgi:hypothetical protein